MHRYVIERRVAEAAFLLKTSDDSIAATARLETSPRDILMLRSAPMSDDVLALLDRKRVLLERRQQTPSVRVPEIERELREIDRALT